MFIPKTRRTRALQRNGVRTEHSEQPTTKRLRVLQFTKLVPAVAILSLLTTVLTPLPSAFAAAKPPTPTIDSVVAISSFSATVTFTESYGAGNAPTSYIVTATPPPVTATLTSPLPASGVQGTITVTGLTPGTSYTFTLIAHNAAGDSGTAGPAGPITTFQAPTIASATITGTAKIGETLTAVAGAITGIPTPTSSYEWFGDAVPIGGATASTYVPVLADLGKAITVTITVTNVAGSDAKTSTPTSAVVGVAPTIASATITGTAKIGETLTAVAGAITGIPTPTSSYEWFGDAVPIGGATASTYVPVLADLGKAITVTIMVTNVAGSETRTSTATSAVVGVAPTIASATITGTAKIGETLTAVAGAITGIPTPTSSYEWFGDAVPIGGATASTYVPVLADLGKAITVTITVTNVAGSETRTSTATSAVVGVAPTIASAAITGTAVIGETLTAVAGTITGIPTPTSSYEWFADAVPIGGATASTYVPVLADLGKAITVTITVTNGAGSDTETSTATSAVVAASSAKAITAFSFASPAATGVVTESSHSIAITVPFGTNVTALVASFTTTGVSVAVNATPQVSGATANNFTSPVIYRVTAADASTQDYIVSVTIAPAIAPAIHTVTFDANGGLGSMVNQIASVPTALTLNGFSRSGYTFAGWNTASNGTGTPYANGGTYGFASDATLYAQWAVSVVVVVPTHTVTFVANGGAGSMSAQTASVATALIGNAFTRAGYNFAGWNTLATGLGTAYVNGATYSFAVDLTLYAQWTQSATPPAAPPTPIAQAPLVLHASSTLISLVTFVALSTTGGSGNGVVTYATSTPAVCSVDVHGLVIGLKVGTCTASATKAGDATYLAATSAPLDLTFVAVTTTTVKPPAASPGLPATGLFASVVRTVAVSGSALSKVIKVNLGASFSGKKVTVQIRNTRTGTYRTLGVVALNKAGIAKLTRLVLKGSAIRVLVGGKSLATTRVG